MISRSFTRCMLLITLQLYTLESEAVDLNNRQATDDSDSTCGYFDGDASQPRTANPGFRCVDDATYGIWGFCTTAVQVPNAGNCGMIGRCTDSASCTTGCGRWDLSISPALYSTLVWYACLEYGAWTNNFD
jgi:hypothetical protein